MTMNLKYISYIPVTQFYYYMDSLYGDAIHNFDIKVKKMSYFKLINIHQECIYKCRDIVAFIPGTTDLETYCLCASILALLIFEDLEILF